MPTETNWSGVHRYGAERVHEPRTRDEVRRLVAGSRHVRGLGNRHSFNEVADSEGGDLISLRKVPLDAVVDRERMVVTANAGATYTELAQELDGQGLALHNLASLPRVTLAGAIATGTHGSGDENGSLATALRGVELVRSDGTLSEVDDHDPDWDGFPVSLGYLGLLTRVTLAVQPAFTARQHIYRDVPWEQLLGNFDEIMAGYSTSVFMRWRGPVVEQVWRKSVVDPGAEAAAPPERWFGGELSPRTSSLPVLEGTNITARDGSPGPWWLRVPHFLPDGVAETGNEMQTEYMVSRGDAAGALSAVRALADRIHPLLTVTELRTVAADRLWLSPMFERPTLCIHFTWHREPEGVRALLPAIEAALEPFAPRPHWGKVFTLDRAALASRYPLLPRFRELVRRWDPDRTFSNAFYRRYLQGEE